MTEQLTRYNTIKAPSEGYFRDRGSKFHGYVFPVSSRVEALAELEQVKSEHVKARHHCFAWRLGAGGEDFRAADDGEPAGSAGQPILNQLLSSEVTYIMAIVVRYFGGTKLGIPGLINAYKLATQDALSNAAVVAKELSAFYRVVTNYDHAARLMSAFKDNEIEVEEAVYEADVTFNLKIPLSAHRDKLNHALVTGFQVHAVEMLEDIPEEELHLELTGKES